MNRRDAVLAALAASDGVDHTPVQMQKLVFLIEKKLPHLIDQGPHFTFTPYDYGPFDHTVYREIEALSQAGLAEIVEIEGARRRTYRLTPQGQESGRALLRQIDPNVADYLKKLSAFIRGLTFSQLVSTIYKHYPEMKANSVFRG